MAISNQRVKIVIHILSGVIAVLLLTILGLIIGTALTPARAGGGFNVTSPDIKDGGVLKDDFVFNEFGCTGKNISPALKWSGAPAGTSSFAITAYDPDAPTGSGWWHWVVYNLPASSMGVPTGMGSGAVSLPKNANQGMNDYGSVGYGGACPPKGDKPHRYIFTVYALKVARFDVPDRASPAMIGFNINANKLAEASITVTYGR